jgi:hypothetical protein
VDGVQGGITTNAGFNYVIDGYYHLGAPNMCCVQLQLN